MLRNEFVPFVAQGQARIPRVVAPPTAPTAPTGALIGVRYRVTLYADEVQLAPLELPCSHISISKRQFAPWYIAVTVPNGVLYGDTIDQRVGNLLRIAIESLYDSGDTASEVLADAVAESVNIDIGPHSSSLMITCYTQHLFNSSSAWVLANAIRVYQQSGKYRLQIPCDTRIKPGDTVTYGTHTFVANWINIQIGANDVFMEMGED